MTTIALLLRTVTVIAFTLLIGTLTPTAALAQDGAPAQPPGSSNPVDSSTDFQKIRRTCQDSNVASALPSPIGQLADLTGLGDQWEQALCLGAATVLDPGGALVTGAQSSLSAFWGDPVGDFAKAVMEGNSQAFRTVMTFWMTPGIPGMAADTAMSGLRNIISGFTVAALFTSIVIAMTRLAAARKQAVMEGATETANMLVRTVMTVTLLPTLVLMFHQGGDIASAYALEKFVGGDLNQKIAAISAVDDKTGLGPIFALACAGFAFLGSCAQLIALLIREAVLAVVVAIIPIAAASSATGTGRGSYKSMISFTIGALLFKPVATLIYLFAFWAASTDATQSSGDRVVGVVIGSLLLAVVGFSLPSLIRVVAPAAESISAGGGQVAALSAGGAAIAGGAAGAAGAAHARSGGGGRSGSSGGGGGGGRGGSAGTGSRPTPGLQGRYAGGSGNSQSGGAVVTAARGAASAAGAAVTGGAAGALKVAATGARMASKTVAGVGSAAEGAIGNYHGRIQR